MLAMTGVVFVLLVAIGVTTLLVMMVVVIPVHHNDFGPDRSHCHRFSGGRIAFAYGLANGRACGTADTCAHDGTRLAAHGLAHGGTSCASNGATHDRAGLAFALRGYGCACSTAHRTTDDRAGLATDRLANRRTGRRAHAATDSRLGRAVRCNGMPGHEQERECNDRKFHIDLSCFC